MFENSESSQPTLKRRRYDVVIIGSGAGGGTLAYRLAPSGKSILLIERGDYLPREKENWSSRDVFVDSRYKAHETWLDSKGKPFHPGIHYYVGGNTKVYGAALLRFRERDFEELKHAGGVSPAWPLKYSDFAPYYREAETLYHVHGQRGSDPTEPPEDAPYPHPPVSHEPRISALYEDFIRIGRSPFPLPLGIQLNEKDRVHSACIRCSTCDGFPCLVNAKSDAQVICVDPALKHPNVELLRRTTVHKLVTDSSGRVIRKILANQDGVQIEIEGDIVVVACGAINSAALLLSSTSDRHPEGLANGSGQVGRNYMCHNNSALLAVSKRPNPTVFQKTLALNDFYFGADDYDLPMGHIQMLGKSDLEMMREDAPRFAPGLALDFVARHSLDFWLTSEDLPAPENRVLVSGDGAISLHYTPNNLEGHERLVAKLKAMLSEIGCEKDQLFLGDIYLGKKIPIAGTAHQCGTLRFGRDPKTSVLDTNCKAHELDNLYAVDGSFFVSSTAVNPALTIIANALRVGDHLLSRLK